MSDIFTALINPESSFRFKAGIPVKLIGVKDGLPVLDKALINEEPYKSFPLIVSKKRKELCEVKNIISLPR